jgi:Uma2 family endonuclease
VTFIAEENQIHIDIPDSVRTLASFRNWARSSDFPAEGRICYLGQVWIDMSKEQLFSHNGIKTEFGAVLHTQSKNERSGRYFCDGARLSNAVADLSAVPDGMFVSWQTLEAGGVQLIEGAGSGFVELEGSPDMTLEAVSDSSVEKDAVELRDLYWKAGVTEYWLIDARDQPPQFTILRWEPDGYVAVEPTDGWRRSDVFAKEFKVDQTDDPGGNPEFRLESR